MSEQKFNFDELILLRLKGGHETWDVGHYAYEHNGFIALVGGIKCNKDCYTAIPYKGNEHLLGTADDPKPKWEPKEGEVIKVRDCEEYPWAYRHFKRMTNNEQYECYSECSYSTSDVWKFGRPLTDKEKGNG